MTAVEVCQVVQDLDIDVARRHHVEISTVIAELAGSAHLHWPWTHADPTVALLRALARLALVAPRATSERAPSLCGRLRDQARRSDRATASSEHGVAS